jgi:hypothetical protein
MKNREVNFFVAVLLLATGCGQDGPKTYPVNGRVVWESGSPVIGGLVEFEATEGPWRGCNARGAIQEDGSFELATKGFGQGAVAGLHRIIVRSPYPTASQMGSREFLAKQIDPKFGTYGQSGLEFVVEENDNSFRIAVTPYQSQ